MLHHNDIGMCGYSIASLRVFVRVLQRDMKKHPARYIDDRYAALKALQENLRAEGFIGLASFGGIVRIAWQKKVHSSCIVEWVQASRR